MSSSSFLLSHSDREPVDLLAAPDASELVFKVHHWISRIIFVVLGVRIELFCYHVPHARVHKDVEGLKSISDPGTSASKAAVSLLISFFMPQAEPERSKENQYCEGRNDRPEVPR
jgi:hypothetical protein